MRKRLFSASLCVLWLGVGCAAGPEAEHEELGRSEQELSPAGNFPNESYAEDKLWTLISPTLGAAHHNQPSAFNGYLVLAGNAKHEIWNVADPTAPEKVTGFDSMYASGEAESHQLSYARYPSGQYYMATISGLGVDIWNVTNSASPKLESAVVLEGINYGDNTEAVWGIAYQGHYIYAGGTNTGLHVIDAADPKNPVVVKRIPTTEFGGVSAGPVFAMGNVLVVVTPKQSAGIATLDISDPENPTLLDYETSTTVSYIGGFYGKYAVLISPLRIYDVLSDPTDITSISSTPTEASEYVSFGDDYLFLGALRPNPGADKIDISDPTTPEVLGKVVGRPDFGIDDQFTLKIGNLLVLSDDQASFGSVIGVHATAPDTQAPYVIAVEPRDLATGQALTSRVGISFSDQLDLATVDPKKIIVRPVGGDALEGSLNLTHTLLTFAPSEPLEPNTTYEVVVPAGGVQDLVGNDLESEFKSSFSTGDKIDPPPPEAGGTGGSGGTSGGGGSSSLAGTMSIAGSAGTGGTGLVGGTGGTPSAGSGETGGTSTENSDAPSNSDSGCSCRNAGNAPRSTPIALMLALMLTAWRRRSAPRKVA